MFAGEFYLSEAFTSLGIRCLFRAGKTAFPARGTLLSSLEEDCLPCSRCSSNIARGFRVALSKGLDTSVSRGSIRAYQGFRYGRIERFDTGGSIGGAYASIIAHPQLIQTIIAVYDVLETLIKARRAFNQRFPHFLKLP